MLNKNNIRELCYIVKIDNVVPIEGRDRVECAIVNGWTIMVRKDVFKPGDIGVYFEIDSRVPEKECFGFLASKHYKIKTQKYKTPNGHFWSQGLLMSAEDLGWTATVNAEGRNVILDDEGNWRNADDDSRFLTEKLGVIYAEDEDNTRKGKTSSGDKYKAMAGRHPKIFKNPIIKAIYKTNLGKKFLYLIFGAGKKKTSWPSWVKKTDEERVQNMPWILNEDHPWIATEKIDGTSTTFTMKRGSLLKGKEFYVCSRNVVFTDKKQDCYYDSNYYLEMAKKYNIKEKLSQMLDEHPQWDWVTVQGETFGDGVQKRTYGLKGERRFRAFNFITSENGRWNSVMAADYLDKYSIPFVPIISDRFTLPSTVPELLEMATGLSTYDNELREGIVFRSYDGTQSFKAVSNEYLDKYHG